MPDSASIMAGPSTLDTCVWPDRGSVQIRGTVRREQRFGPPGYGETPKRDEKLEIFVLHTPKRIRFCGDTAIKHPAPVPELVENFQLTGAVDTTELRRLIGTQQTVFGRFVRQVWGSDFTPILIRVDSLAGGLGRAPQGA
ncbi:MAG TPA: hypothetical protein VFK16_10470 [Gemmatimonadaceae bacterium]|nr:hypothetical protein [Gemmatimonadaceae bacterium]